MTGDADVGSLDDFGISGAIASVVAVTGVAVTGVAEAVAVVGIRKTSSELAPANCVEPQTAEVAKNIKAVSNLHRLNIHDVIGIFPEFLELPELPELPDFTDFTDFTDFFRKIANFSAAMGERMSGPQLLVAWSARAHDWFAFFCFFQVRSSSAESSWESFHDDAEKSVKAG